MSSPQPETPEVQAEGYWYGTPVSRDVIALLQSLRRFRRADAEMRRRKSLAMGMNGTDMQALQLVIAASGSGHPATPRAIARHLGITTASTTKMLDRLAASGHLERSPHPRDRRSLQVLPTESAHREIQELMGRMHARMAEIAAAVPVASRDHVRAFLDAMALEMAAPDAAGAPEPDARALG